MQHRWMDPNNSFEVGDEPAIFVGGTGETDIWVVPETNVLICQYEDDDVWNLVTFAFAFVFWVLALIAQWQGDYARAAFWMTVVLFVNPFS